MRQAAWALAAGMLLCTDMAQAEGLAKSLLPKARPATTAQVSATPDADLPPTADLVVATVSSSNAVQPLKRPLPRPEGLAERYAATMADLAAPKLDPGSVVEVAAVTGLRASLLPLPRPKGLAKRRAAEPEAPEATVQKAAVVRTLPGKTAVLPKKGSVCGDPEIRGAALAPITSRVKGCGVEDPVKVTQIAGVAISPAATITCETAKAAKQWIERGVQPAFDNQVVKLQIAGSYVCRTRNHKKGAKVSEHGKGRALDISGFVLADGRALSVVRDYRKSRAMKASHRAACGPFGTTLGPGSDGMHEDHLHMDIVSYRNGTYCK